MNASAASSYQNVRAFDSDALGVAHQFGLSVARSDSSFVSYDGEGTLNIAPDDHLDADDTLLQIILHELAHFWTEGTASHSSMDWGLSNLSDDHLDREYAALRLQYDIVAPFTLQSLLHPTTVHRWFYDCLLNSGESTYVPTTEEATSGLEAMESPVSVKEVLAATKRSRELHEQGLNQYEADPRSASLRQLLRQVALRIRADRG
jgi:hypothetical protein